MGWGTSCAVGVTKALAIPWADKIPIPCFAATPWAATITDVAAASRADAIPSIAATSWGQATLWDGVTP